MADTQEIKLWEWCKTHGDYAGYLMQYPNGSFAAEANMLINGNNGSTQINASSYGSEQDEYNNCILLSEFYAFVKKYPNGEYTTKAKTVISTKQILTSCGFAPSEEGDFKACQVAKEYKRFLEKYPMGRYSKQAKEKYEQIKARNEAWDRDRKDEDKLRECETIEDYSKYLETHQGKFAKMAENHIGALKNEKWQLILVIILNIIGIAAVITGLIMNKTNIVGFVLLGLGFIELVAHFVIPFEKRVLTKGDNYLQLSGYLSLISGIVFLLI